MVYWILYKDKNGSYLGTFNHHLPPIKISDSEIELVQLRNSDHSSEISNEFKIKIILIIFYFMVVVC